MNWLSSACLLALGLFFASSVWPKIRKPSAFVSALQGYGFPRAVATVLAPLMAAVEAVVAIACLVEFRPIAAAWTCVGLLVAYSAFVAYAMLTGRDNIQCGCFAFGSDRVVRWSLLLRNGLVTTLAIATATGPRVSYVAPRPWFMIAMAALTFLVVIAISDELGHFQDVASTLGEQR